MVTAEGQMAEASPHFTSVDQSCSFLLISPTRYCPLWKEVNPVLAHLYVAVTDLRCPSRLEADRREVLLHSSFTVRLLMLQLGSL